MKVHTIDDIVYPVMTKKGIKYEKKSRKSDFHVPVVQDAPPQREPVGKLLDGFLLLFSCRVKLPHEAIRSKLSG